MLAEQTTANILPFSPERVVQHHTILSLNKALTWEGCHNKPLLILFIFIHRSIFLHLVFIFHAHYTSETCGERCCLQLSSISSQPCLYLWPHFKILGFFFVLKNFEPLAFWQFQALTEICWALNYDSFSHYEFIACGCLWCCNASPHGWQDSTFACFHYLPVVDWAGIFCFHKVHVKCAEQKQNTLHCNSLEYCVPFMEVAWQTLPSLYWSTVWICASPPLPWVFLIFVHEMPNLFVTAKHCTFLLKGHTFFFLPSSPTQSEHKIVLQYALQWYVSFNFKGLT